jgi:stress response protein SCP2
MQWLTPCDIDLHITTYDSSKTLLEHVYYENRSSRTQSNADVESSIFLNRDDRSGAGGGEQVWIDVSSLPADTASGLIWCTFFSQYGSPLGAVDGLKTVLQSSLQPQKEIYTYNLTNEAYSTSAVVLGQFFKFTDGAWWYRSVGRAVENTDSPNDPSQVSSRIY